jgi:hypothetical protein
VEKTKEKTEFKVPETEKKRGDERRKRRRRWGSKRIKMRK